MRFDELLLQLFQLGEYGLGGQFFGALIGLLQNPQAFGSPQQLDLQLFCLSTAQIDEWRSLLDTLTRVDIDFLDTRGKAWGHDGDTIWLGFDDSRDFEDLFERLGGRFGHL